MRGCAKLRLLRQPSRCTETQSEQMKIALYAFQTLSMRRVANAVWEEVNVLMRRSSAEEDRCAIGDPSHESSAKLPCRSLRCNLR